MPCDMFLDHIPRKGVSLIILGMKSEQVKEIVTAVCNGKSNYCKIREEYSFFSVL